jgi:hypothetical protein
MQAFHEILRAWLGSRSLDEGAKKLRIAPRTLRYLLAGETLPHDSTLALIEREVARGAHVSVDALRQSVVNKRSRRHGRDGAVATTGATDSPVSRA